ncbi:hypothetical protein [Thalassovita mangrovi]|uniref:hypothetical protein n=1 Tax=Thalassovita mangrovi TaxID=2692236 RepID=UPI001BB2E2C9|nr:hypothetical protein [Thalassovita mangrovi]
MRQAPAAGFGDRTGLFESAVHESISNEMAELLLQVVPSKAREVDRSVRALDSCCFTALEVPILVLRSRKAIKMRFYSTKIRLKNGQRKNIGIFSDAPLDGGR